MGRDRSMKYILTLLFLMSFGSGCANEVFIHSSIKDASYSADTSEIWLKSTILSALDFWQQHGITLRYVEHAPRIPVAVGFTFGGDSYFSDLEQKIVLSRDYLENNNEVLTSDQLEIARTCITAHEIGHSLGMPHVSNKNSLMYETAGVDFRHHICFWSDEDQTSLDRTVLEQKPE